MHEIVVFENGTASLTSPETGEAMHSSIGPWQEARSLYIEQSGLAERLSLATPEPVVIYDLGLGLAANAIAALHDQKVGPTFRRIEIISFENDLSGITTALGNLARFPFLAPYADCVRELLAERRVQRERFSWELREGDFLAQDLSKDAAELFFFDFYSPKSGSALWSREVFERLRGVAEKKKASNPLLLTYSAATPVRAGMLLSGFFVGRGVMTATKSETTIAALKHENLRDPLGSEWLEKLARSDRYAPFGMEALTRDEMLAQMRTHPQFS